MAGHPPPVAAAQHAVAEEHNQFGHHLPNASADDPVRDATGERRLPWARAILQLGTPLRADFGIGHDNSPL
ncbi:MAG TPA: hypothetical protein VHG11_00855, partial [Pseudorhizobium sp.]|nr:hypothetical protein [Pseudorhizobium sp.]